jgi:hypothetical protein
MVNIVGTWESRVRIVKYVPVGTNIARRLIATTMGKDPKSIWRRNSEVPYLENYNLSTPAPLINNGNQISSSNEGQKDHYAKKAYQCGCVFCSVDVRGRRHEYTTTGNGYQWLTFLMSGVRCNTDDKLDFSTVSGTWSSGEHGTSTTFCGDRENIIYVSSA